MSQLSDYFMRRVVNASILIADFDDRKRECHDEIAKQRYFLYEINHGVIKLSISNSKSAAKIVREFA